MSIVTNAALSDFFDGLGYRLEVFQEVKNSYDIYVASDFNVFDWLSTEENMLSAVIAFLLDPKEKHSQGNAFLNSFLQKLEFKEMDYFAEVKKRHWTDKGREIDILITLKKDDTACMVAIENKPWHTDENKQIEDYNEYVGRKSKEYKLIYLHKLGEPPSENSIKRNDWKELVKQGIAKQWSYSGDLKDWLEACYRECKAEKVRHFVLDFINWIDKNEDFKRREENEQPGD